MRRRRFAARTTALATILLTGAPAAAQVSLQWGPADSRAAIPVELALFDAPYNLDADLDSPSMAQSLALSSGAYSLMHGALGLPLDPWGQTRWKRWLSRGIIATADLFTVVLPPLLGWQHEEWHRAVLSHRQMGSYNDIYNFDLLAEVVAVSHVKDEDLVRLKAEHPADQVRLSTAGIEGNYALAHELEAQAFFADSPAFHQVLVALLYLGNSDYLDTCASNKGDQTTDRSNALDGTDIARRDFTGLDCVGWVYDLHRPDEPYAARGTHPSGVGIDRYRKLSHLTEVERGYLRRQAKLSLLNFLDPYIVGIYGLQIDRGPEAPLVLSLALRHLPTSFGYVIRADVALRMGKWKALLQQQNYVNGQRWLPGLDLALLHHPLWRGRTLGLDLSARLAGWLQPARQRFDSDDATAGGLAGLRLALALHPRLAPFVEIEAKSAGWVVGNVALERDLSVRAGLALRLF